MRTAITVGLLGVMSAGCLVGNGPEGSTDQAIKGRNKMFASSRAQHNVESYDWDGVEGATLVGAGLTTPFGVHVDGDDVYVVSQGRPATATAPAVGSSVYAHHHEEGEAGDRHKLDVIVPLGSGLAGAFYPTTHGDRMYVSSGGTHQILSWDKLTGANQSVFVAADPNGVRQPRGIDFDGGGNLFVASHMTNQVLVFDSGGNFVREFAQVPTPCGVSIDPNGRVCVGSAPPHPKHPQAATAVATGVHCFNADGTKFYGTGSGAVCGLDWGRDGSIYITRTDGSLGPNTRVEEHDFVNAPATFATLPGAAGVSWGNEVGN